MSICSVRDDEGFGKKGENMLAESKACANCDFVTIEEETLQNLNTQNKEVSVNTPNLC